MRYRANWPQLKTWLSQPGLSFSCLERGTGLYVNCKSLEELHITLMSSPSIRADYNEALKTIELYKGHGIVAIDNMAATRLSRKMKNLRRHGIPKHMRLFRDEHGGIVVVGETLNLDIDAMLGDYAKWLENKANELERSKDTRLDVAGNDNTVPGSDPVSGEVPREERSEATGLQPENGSAGPSDERSDA